MKINIKSTKLEVTPSLRIYIEEKLGALKKYVRRFDEAGVAELWVEAGRTTRHHQKGEVFVAEADLRLPRKILRAVQYGNTIRAAIDKVKDTLHLEIEKYRTKGEARRERPKRT